MAGRRFTGYLRQMNTEASRHYSQLITDVLQQYHPGYPRGFSGEEGNNVADPGGRSLEYLTLVRREKRCDRDEHVRQENFNGRRYEERVLRGVSIA